MLALNHGSELFEVDADGPRLLERRRGTAAEDAALTRAADETVSTLGARETCVVSQRLNRRKIDLIPIEAWADPPKSQIDQLLSAVEDRLRHAGLEPDLDVFGVTRDLRVGDSRQTADATG